MENKKTLASEIIVDKEKEHLSFLIYIKETLDLLSVRLGERINELQTDINERG